MIEFTKISAQGNDFIVLDNRDSALDHISQAAVRHLCDRRTGIGGDGLLLLCPSDRAEYRMRIFNTDGTEATMCGNGSRALALFAHQQGVIGTDARFEAADGLHHVQINPDHDPVQIELAILPPAQIPLFRPDIDDDEDFQRLLRQWDLQHAGYMNTGVPHEVLVSPDVNQLDLIAAGRAIRNHSRFAPIGTNVVFMTPFDRQHLHMRVYEKGVEDETWSCGTGAVAGVLLLAVQGQVDSPVKVQQPGGPLAVKFSPDLQELSFRGEIRTAFTGQLPLKLIDLLNMAD